MATVDINDVAPEVDYLATASQTEFDIPFEFFDNEDLVVTVNESSKALDTDYTVTGAEVEGGGTLTFTTALSLNDRVRIVSDIAAARDVEYVQSGNLPHDVLERDFQKIIRLIQQFDAKIGRSIRLLDTDTSNTDLELPLAAVRADTFLVFDSAGDLALSETLPSAQAFNQSTIGTLLWPRTDAEIAANVTPTNYFYEPGNILRYGGDPTGVADSRAALQAAINQASHIESSGDDYAGRLVYCPAGLYKISGKIYLYRPDDLNDDFSTDPLHAGRMTIKGDGRGHGRDIADGEVQGTVLKFTETSGDQFNFGFPLDDVPSTYANIYAMKLANLIDINVTGVTTGSLVAMRHNSMGQIRHVVIHNNPASSGVALDDEYSWGLIYDDVWIYGPAYKDITTLGHGTGWWKRGDSDLGGDTRGGGGTNWLQNVNVNGFQHGCIIGREWSEEKLGHLSAYIMQHCQFSYCDVGLWLRQGCSELKMYGCWWELNAVNGGSNRVDLLITDGAGYDQNDQSFPGESGYIYVGPGNYFASSNKVDDGGSTITAHIQLGQDTGTLEQDYYGNVILDQVIFPYSDTDGLLPYINIFDNKGNGQLTLRDIQPHNQAQSAVIQFDTDSPQHSPVVIEGDLRPWTELSPHSRWAERASDLASVNMQYVGGETEMFAYIPDGDVTLDYSLSDKLPGVIVCGTLTGETCQINLPANHIRVCRQSQRVLIYKEDDADGIITLKADAMQEWTTDVHYYPGELVYYGVNVYEMIERTSDNEAFAIASGATAPVHGADTDTDDNIEWKWVNTLANWTVNGAATVSFDGKYQAILLTNRAAEMETGIANNRIPKWRAISIGGKRVDYVDPASVTTTQLGQALIDFGIMESS